MSLTIRLIRAFWLLGLIFSSYMVQLGLARVFRREGSIARDSGRLPAWLENRRRRVDEKNARRLHHGFLRLRGVYVKLGQVLSIMGGFLPKAYTTELEALQDRVPPRPFREVERVFINSIGRPPRACFVSIEEEPIAAASLGQVHAAVLTDGTKVAVKVLYFGIRDVIRTDMKVVRVALTIWRHFIPVQNIERVHDALVDLLQRETDYLHEASCMTRMASNFENEHDIVFPSVITELTTTDVLTMTYVPGIKITRVEQIEAEGIQRKAVATRLVQSFYRQLFIDRFFHADPHPGNFLVQPGDTPGAFNLVILDFGAISEVSKDTVEGMVDVLQGFFEQKDDLVLRGFERIGFIAAEGDKALLERTVKMYFKKLLKVKDRSAGAVMRARLQDLEALADPEVQRQELRALMRSIRYPDGWFFVERAVILMFWLSGQIDPTLDTLQVGFPYLISLLSARTRSSRPARAM